MWRLIDFKTRYIDNGCDVEMVEDYLITNGEVSKWIDEYEYRRFMQLGLIKK